MVSPIHPHPGLAKIIKDKNSGKLYRWPATAAKLPPGFEEVKVERNSVGYSPVKYHRLEMYVLLSWD